MTKKYPVRGCSRCKGRRDHPGRKLCKGCRDEARARKARLRARRRMEGACVLCSAVLEQLTLDEGYDTCPSCRDAARERWAAWEKRHPEYKRPYYDGWFPRRRDG